MIKSSYLATAIIALPLAFGGVASAQTAAKKPNIVMIMADDVGIWNISAYHRGMMGGTTPNIDRIAREGALFTDYYAQQSCTAGRAAFITGQTPFRTGLLKVGLPARQTGPAGSRTRRSPNCSSPSATPRRRSARTISATATNTFPRCTASTSSTASSTTSTRWKSRTRPITRRTRNSSRCSVRATSWIPRRRPRTIRPRIRAGAGSASRRSPTAARCRRTRTWTPKPSSTWRDVDDELVRRSVDFIDRSVEGRQAILPLAQLHAHACLDSSLAEVAGQERLRPLRRRHDGTGLRRSAKYSRRSMISASPTTPSWSSPATTAPRPSPGRMAAIIRSAARRARLSRAASACPWWRAGPAPSSQAPSSTRSSPAKTGCRPCWPPQAIRT